MQRLNELEKQLMDMRKLLYEREKEIYELRRQFLPSNEQPKPKLWNRLTTSEIQILNVTNEQKIQPQNELNSTTFYNDPSNSQCLMNGINTLSILNPIIQASIGQSEIFKSSIEPSTVQAPVVQSPIAQPSIMQPSPDQTSIYQPFSSQSSIFQSSVDQSLVVQSPIVQPSIAQPSPVQTSVYQPFASQSSIFQSSVAPSPVFQPSIIQSPIVQANEVLDETIYYLDQNSISGITPVSGQILVPLNQLIPLNNTNDTKVPNKKIEINKTIVSSVPIKTESDLESNDSNSNMSSDYDHFNNDESTSATEEVPKVQFRPDIPNTSIGTDNNNVEQDIVTIKTEDVDLGADDLLEQGGTVIAIQDGQVVDTLTEIIKQHSTILHNTDDGKQDKDTNGDLDKDTNGDIDEDTNGDIDKDTNGGIDKDKDAVTVKTEIMDADTECATEQQQQQDLGKVVKDEKLDDEKSKEKEQELDCVIDCIIENPMPKKERVKRKMEPTLDPGIKGVPGVWSCEIVCDEQMWEWRQEDSTSEEYRTAPFRCSSCIVGFQCARDSRNHNLMAHSPRIGLYICDVCQMRCPEEYILNEHRDTHKRIYRCLKCDFGDRDHAKLLKHCDTFTHSSNTCKHSNDKLKCELCNPKTPPSKMRTFRSSVFTCDYCSQTYITRASLVNHISMQHMKSLKSYVKPKPVPTPSPQKLQFECYTCKKRFRFQGELFSHRKLFHPYRKRVYHNFPQTGTPNVTQSNSTQNTTQNVKKS